MKMERDASWCSSAAARMNFQFSAARVARPAVSDEKKASGGGLPAAWEMAVVSSLSVLPNDAAISCTILSAPR